MSPAAAEREVALPSGLVAHVVTAGPGAGAPDLLYCHGIDAPTADDPLLGALAERFNVHAPVAPGFRDLAELDDIEDVRDLALHYEELIAALGLTRPAVVGHSFGGMVAAELAAHFPAVVGPLVLVAPLGLWRDEAPVADLFGVGVGELAGLLFADPTGPAAKASGALIEADGPPDTDRLVALVQGFSAVAKFVWPIPDRGLAKRLRRIATPVLVVWGAEDKVVPASYARQFEAAIAGSTAAVVEGAGHMVVAEATDLVVGLVEGFLG